jgi:hypothetical protein
MYPTFVSNCMMERVWRFGLPLLLAQLHNSLLPVAVVSFVGQFVIFAAGPWVGALMDSMPRVVAFNTLCILQVRTIWLASVDWVLSLISEGTLNDLCFLVYVWS